MGNLGKHVQLYLKLFPWKGRDHLRNVRMAYERVLLRSGHSYRHSKNIFFAKQYSNYPHH